jgi:UDP-glucose:(heptosyl)LPS alpha-1,3-glucosyltransferase
VKVGLVTERIGAALGGAERWTYDFARWLVTQGHDVHIVCRADRRNQPPGGAARHDVACGRSPLAFGAAAAVVVDHLRCDVTHDMGSGWNCDVFQPHCGSRTAAIRRNLDLVAPGLRRVSRSIQPLLPRYRNFAALCRLQYAVTGRTYIAVSHRVARDFEQFHHVDSGRIRVIHNGVDIEQLSPAVRDRLRAPAREQLGLADGEVALLLVAHNLRLKGLPTLIRGAAALRRQGAPVKLLVVGSTRTAQYARLCRRLGVDARFAGPVPDPLTWYAAADVYVHPTFYDPCSLVVLEAWACGLPVITSRFNGCAELMTEDLAEFVLTDPASVRDLVQGLERLLDPGTRLRIGVSARRLAETHSAVRCFERFLDVYAEIRAVRRAAA